MLPYTERRSRHQVHLLTAREGWNPHPEIGSPRLKSSKAISSVPHFPMDPNIMGVLLGVLLKSFEKAFLGGL